MVFIKIQILNCFLLLLTGNYDFKKNCKVIVPGLGIQNEIELGMVREDILETFGKSDKCKLIRRETEITWSEGVKKNKYKVLEKRIKNVYCKESLGLRIIFNKGEVYKIFFSSNEYTLTQDIKIGSSRETILNKYGVKGDSPRLWIPELGIAFHFDSKNQLDKIEILKSQF